MASSRIDVPTTKPMTSQSRPDSRSAMSENMAVVPVTSTPSGTASRTSCTSAGVRSSVGPHAGTALNTLMAPSADCTGGVTATTSSRAPSVVDEVGQSALVDHVVVDHEGEGAVVARAELLGDQVVGLARGEVGGLGAGVLRPRAHVEHRQCEHEHHQRGADRPGERRAADPAGPACRQRHLGRSGRVRVVATGTTLPYAVAGACRRTGRAPAPRSAPRPSRRRRRSRWRSRRSRRPGGRTGVGPSVTAARSRQRTPPSGPRWRRRGRPPRRRDDRPAGSPRAG